AQQKQSHRAFGKRITEKCGNPVPERLGQIARAQIVQRFLAPGAVRPSPTIAQSRYAGTTKVAKAFSAIPAGWSQGMIVTIGFHVERLFLRAINASQRLSRDSSNNCTLGFWLA